MKSGEPVGADWAGHLDQVHIFDRVISLEEIQTLYNEVPSPVEPVHWGAIKSSFK